MFNFENIGGKIKTLAVVVTILGIGVSVFFGLYMLSEEVMSGILIAFIGSVFHGFQHSLCMASVN